MGSAARATPLMSPPSLASLAITTNSGDQMLLNELSCDVLEAVVRNLSPSDVGSLVSTCKALQASATPRLVDWAWLREHADDLVGRYSVCRTAAGEGRLQALRWARALGCPWDSWVCRFAAFGGHLEVLQWARVNGCEWSHQIFRGRPRRASALVAMGARAVAAMPLGFSDVQRGCISWPSRTVAVRSRTDTTVRVVRAYVRGGRKARTPTFATVGKSAVATVPLG